MKYMYSGDFLCHYKKGKESQNHKYKSREFKNGKWIYNYGDTSVDKSKNASSDNVEKPESIVEKSNTNYDSYYENSKKDYEDIKSYLDSFNNLSKEQKAIIFGDYDTEQYKYYQMALDAENEYAQVLAQLEEVKNYNDESIMKKVVFKLAEAQTTVHMAINGLKNSLNESELTKNKKKEKKT